MHRCLEIAEIVDMICSQLYRPSDLPWFVEGGASPQDLAVAARTCTTFNGPALDYLWKSISLQTLLMRCMPSDLWALDKTSVQMRPYVARMRLLRPLRLSDWDRIRLYASRVQRLTCDPAVCSEAFPALTVSLPHGIFSNLRAVTWSTAFMDQDNSHYISLFLPPTLTEISFHVASHSAASLLPTLAQKCPQLTNVSISHDSLYCPDVSRSVLQLPAIAVLSVTTLDQEAFQYFSSLASLNSLTLDNLPSSFTLSSKPGSDFFPNLRTLAFDYPTIGSATHFIEMCRNVPLQRFSVLGFEPQPATATEVQRLFTAITAGFSHSTFTSLVLYNPSVVDGDDLVPFSTLQRLFAFRGLVTLNLTFVVGFNLDDNNVAELARAWPQMEVLLLPGQSTAITPRATLACLSSFARYCPHLHTLGIALDATALLKADSSHGHQQCLQLIDVGYSPIKEPSAVARFVSAVFPKVKTIDTFQDNHDENEDETQHPASIYRRLWGEVLHALPEVVANGLSDPW
ncbi:hypothetical protein DFH06DRAFT_1062672 [Mycena polygramma]|nr:hypothetical protein DFH06DRAFT_1062672 [Mycena polygramma]